MRIVVVGTLTRLTGVYSNAIYIMSVNRKRVDNVSVCLWFSRSNTQSITSLTHIHAHTQLCSFNMQAQCSKNPMTAAQNGAI